MWTAKHSKQNSSGVWAAADQGSVTLGGNPAGVYLDADRRWMQVYAPGGYQWKPKARQQVLVIKSGQQGESSCVAGRLVEEDGMLKPGEVTISSDAGAKISLTNEGKICLAGAVEVGGEDLEALIRRVVMDVLKGR